MNKEIVDELDIIKIKQDQTMLLIQGIYLVLGIKSEDLDKIIDDINKEYRGKYNIKEENNNE